MRKIKIDTDITEQELIECCLNSKCSGCSEWKLPLLFYALGKRWNVKKLSYYLNMIEEVK